MTSPGVSKRFNPAVTFWISIAAITAGVALHLPMYLGARHKHYMLAGMGWTPTMIAGMGLISAGLAGTCAAIWRTSRPAHPRKTSENAAPTQRLRGALIAALTIAIAIDTLKPFTFTYIVGGVAKEYGLSSPAHPIAGRESVALLPLAGIAGTLLGSILWGVLADRVGRRGTLLFAAAIFIATAPCGVMPSFSWNLGMCSVMGMGAGGMLPVAYALLTEAAPTRTRGLWVVLIAGLGTGLGFLLAAGLAAWLIPIFNWRIMWLAGLPTGLAVIGFSSVIPESARCLAHIGKVEPATQVSKAPSKAAAVRRSSTAWLPAALCLAGAAWGLINLGFIVWLPTQLNRAGLSQTATLHLLTWGAAFAFPGCAVAAYFYHRASTKLTVVGTCALSAASLVPFAISGPDLVHHRTVLVSAITILLITMWAVIAVLAPYSAEVFPTHLRATGAGAVAGASKFGGVAALFMTLLGIVPPTLRASALLSAAVMATAAASVAICGFETGRHELTTLHTQSGLFELNLDPWTGSRSHGVVITWKCLLDRKDRECRVPDPVRARRH